MRNRTMVRRQSTVCRAIVGFLALCFSLGPTGTVIAQEAADAEEVATSDKLLEEVIVTAQKRAGNLQDVPIAVSAFTADTLADRQMNSVEDLAINVPGLFFGHTNGQSRVAIRGVGYEEIPPGGEARIAYHVDGTYVSRPAATIGSFFDVERVEVLRGPQGTLYGRNATGGTINVITKGPTDDFEGDARLVMGNYSQLLLEAGIGGPLGERISGRIAVRYESRDGYGYNEYTEHEVDNVDALSFRAKFKLELSDTADMLFTAARHREDDNNYVFHYFGPGSPLVDPLGIRLGGSAASDPRNINNSYDPENDRTFDEYALHFDWAISDQVQLRSISSYLSGERKNLSDLDATADGDLLGTYFAHLEDSDQFSQEIQLAGEGSRSSWLAGIYYFDESIDAATDIRPWSLQLFGGPAVLKQGYWAGGLVDTKAWAIFGEYTWDFSDVWSATVGMRYSWEEKKIHEGLMVDTTNDYSPSNDLVWNVFDLRQSESWDAFTPKFSLQYRFDSGALGYGLISRGFKSGGFNVGGGSPPFDPELVWNYEIGLKADWLGGRLRSNIAAFYYDYADIQVTKVVNTLIVVENAAKADIYGLELEATFIPTDNWTIDFTTSLLDATYSEFETGNPVVPPTEPPTIFDLSGNQMTQAPDYTATLGVQYDWSVPWGRITARAEGAWVDDVYYTPFEDPRTFQKGHGTYNAFLNFYSGQSGWSASLFVRNLSDESIKNSSFIVSGLLGFPVVGGLAPPRTYGIQLGYSFD